MLGELKIPAIVVSGGRDPWMHVGVKPDHGYRNIEYVYFANGLHCPDIYGVDAGHIMFDKARTLGLEGPSPSISMLAAQSAARMFHY